MFTTYDSIVAALGSGNGEDAWYNKASISTTAGRWYSLWKSTGIPSAGSNPGSAAGTAPTNSTAGALQFTNPSGSNAKALLSFGAAGPTAGAVMLYDRLVATSELDGTNTGAQTVNSTALTRHTDGIGVQLAVEVYTALGATPRTLTISYTNSDGTAGRSGTVSIPASAEAGSFIIPMALQSGDKGVKSVQTVTLSGSTGTAGNFGITLFYPIGMISYNANQVVERDMVLQLSNLPSLPASSCLALASLATTTSLGLQFGQLKMAEG